MTMYVNVAREIRMGSYAGFRGTLLSGSNAIGGNEQSRRIQHQPAGSDGRGGVGERCTGRCGDKLPETAAYENRQTVESLPPMQHSRQRHHFLPFRCGYIIHRKGSRAMAYELIEKQVIFEGRKIRMEVHHLRHEETQQRVSREVVVHPGAVVILPLLSDDNVILIRNRRYVVGQILVELPAGTLEKNENPMNCAGRELLEETGYLAGRLKPIGNFYSSPGILSEKMYCYAAYDLQRKKPALEEGEEIEVFQASIDDAVGMIRDGVIADAKSIAAILMYDRFHRSR
jgi:ADP-ribose pyrophosphatase